MTTSEGLRAIGFNVVGGGIVAAGTLLIERLWRKLRFLRFRQVFGQDVCHGVYLKYTEYEPPSRETRFKKPPTIVSRRTPDAHNLTRVASGACARAAAHLAHSFGRNSPTPPIIEADSVADDRMDVSFVALGAANHRALDVLHDPANVFFEFDGLVVRSRGEGRTLVSTLVAADGFDYGMILKIHPEHNPRRTWICCAGFGEWGTSGAAWFLANRWHELRKFAKDRAFACLTKTRIGSDDSTVLTQKFLTKEDVRNASVGAGGVRTPAT